jgi:hypothetical protein
MVYKNGVWDHKLPAQDSLTVTVFYNVYEQCISLHQTIVHAKQGLSQQGD